MATQYCANCGKKFYTSHDGWGYAYAGHYTCTYHCMREMRKEDMITDEQKTTARGMIAEGKETQEIVKETGLSAKVIGGMKARLRHKNATQNTFDSPVQTEQDAHEENHNINDTDRMVVNLIHDMLEVIRRIYGM